MSRALSRRRVLTLMACAAIASGPAEATTWEGIALGARARITLSGPALWRARAFAAIEAEVARAEALFSLYRADSALARLNAQGRLEAPPPEMLELFRTIDHLHRASAGQFDPTVQPLWQAHAAGQPTPRAEAAIGWRRVRHGPAGIALAEGQALTLNGIAQGWATDRVAARLRALDAEHVLVQLGELRALDGPFRIGLPTAGFATLRDKALASSEPAALTLPGGAHILSPDGRPPLWATATVEAEQASLADGLSTAAIFLPPTTLRAARAALPGIGRIWLSGVDGDVIRL